MIKEKFEERTITKKVCVEKTMICDVCGKEIKGEYYEIRIGHNDWGNDSCDSYEYKDICSSSCLNKEIEKYIKRSNDGLNTEFIEIEHNNSPCLYIEKD